MAKGKIHEFKTKDNRPIYPITIGEAVVVGNKTLKGHIKNINSRLEDLESITKWK